MKRPSFQFYPGDWLLDQKLRKCSPAARGVWIDVLCALHNSDDGYGFMRCTLAELANAVGPSKVHLRELVDKGVLRGSDTEVEALVYVPRSGRRDGAPVTLIEHQTGPLWYSKRLVKDEYVRQTRGEGTRFGVGEDESPKPAPKTSPKGGFGEGSGDGSSSSSSSSSSASAVVQNPSGSPSARWTKDTRPDEPRPTIPCPYDAIVDAYHRVLPELPRVKLRDGPTWTDRQKAMRSMWGWVLSSRKTDGTRRAETGADALSWVDAYFRRARDNDFVMGRTPRGSGHEHWRADLDFLLSKKGVRQVIEKTTERAA